MRRLLGALRRRRLVLGGAAAAALLAAVAGTTPGAFGAYTATIKNSTDTAASAPYFRCVDALAADKGSALFQWSLGDATGATVATDISGQNHPGAYQGTTTADSSTPMGCPRDPGTAMRFNGTSTYVDYATQQTNPQTFTLEVDFQTTVKGGKLIGFGTAATGASGQYDRHLYISSTGAVVFGVYNGGYKTLTSPLATYADGKWHTAAVTFSPSTGATLYVDGKAVKTDATSTTAESTNGYWRVGYDTLGGSWPNAPANPYFTGRMRYAAVYTTVLSAAQIAAHAAPVF